MRIIAGEFRSRRLHTPKDASVTRPMPDRVRESLFGLLRGHTEGATVIDLFAGTGSVGLEAVSRGASRCVLVEKDRQIAQILKRNIEMLGVEDRCELVVGDALGPGALARCPRPVNLVFMDPPYPMVRDALGWKRVRTQFERLIDLLTDDGYAVLRTPWPHFIGGPDTEDEPEPRAAAKPRRGRRKGDRDRWRREAWDGPSPGNAEDEASVPEGEIDEGGEELEGEDRRDAPEVHLERADLTFANAEGPETHIYHSMAVHLYMKKRLA